MRRFTQVDVFTNELTFGNPVAVVHDADDLTAQDMADFARWTNLSETTFLIAPTDERADYQLRIFTIRPSYRLPATPRSARPTPGWRPVASPRTPRASSNNVGAGLVRIRRDGTRLAFAAPPLIRGGDVDAEDLTEIMAFLGIEPDVVVDAQWADNGPGWVALLLTDAETVWHYAESCRFRPIQRRRGG